MSHLEANMAVLSRRFPKVAALVAKAEPLPFEMSDTPRPVMCVERMQLASGFDRYREAKCQADTVPAGVHECWVYGHGLGDLPRVLLEREKLKIAVIVMNPALTRTVLEQSDQTDWLASPRVYLEYGGNILNPSRIRTAPFASCHADVRLADLASLELRDRLITVLNTPFNEERFRKAKEADEAAVAANRKFIEVDGPIVEALPHFDAPVAVVAAGPSLKDFYGWLREFKGPIVAVGTALIPLQNAGVYPQFVCNIDPHPDQVLHLQGIDTDRMARSTLVYAPFTTPDYLEFWPGPRKTSDGLFSAGTVTHVAMDLGARIGNGSVYLLGADFCFPKNQNHVDGCTFTSDFELAEWRLWTVDGYGNKVATDNSMMQYHRYAEEYLAAMPQYRFYKLGRSGVPLKGATWLL